MDGFELAAALRSVLPQLPLIALSGYGPRADRARIQSAAFDRYLVKPTEVRHLLVTIAELVREKARDALLET